MADQPDYRALTLAALEAEPAEPEAPVADPAAPPAPVADPAAPAEPAKADEKKVEPEAPKSRFEKSFEDLVREKAALRKQADELKAKDGSIARDQRLMDAVKSGDAMAVLAAAGIPWSKAAQQVIGADGKPEAPAEDPVKSLAAEVAELKAELASKNRTENRNNFLAQAKALAAKEAEKFPYTAGLGEEESALHYIEAYFKENQELPIPNDLPGSLELAMEATENRLRKDAERFSKVKGLTPAGEPGKKDLKPVVPPVVRDSAGKTLTNSTGSGPRGSSGNQPPVRKSEEDYRKAALDLANANEG